MVLQKLIHNIHLVFQVLTTRQLIITVLFFFLILFNSVHSGMGGQINTNTTFGSSNFDGNIKTLVSANTSSGFSIIKYSGTGSQATIGHDLGVTPDVMIIRRIDGAEYSGAWWIINTTVQVNIQALNTTEGGG